MKPGTASITAQRVAAHRLTFEREPADFGDAAADERLAQDVAGDVAVDSAGMMVPYLRARTAFFDRVVVRALDAGMSQVVIAAAGYDGRALRFAKPGVRWFELDHPDTQRDKRDRLERLGIPTDHISFVVADFTVDDVAAGLRAAGHHRSVPTLFLCEGVAVYLELAVLESLLRALRASADDGSRLAISLSVDTGAPAVAARRAAFAEAVAAIGEPARTVLTVDDADALLSVTGWQMVDPSERARHAGLVTAVPAR